MVEMIMVMTLMILFGVTMFTLAAAGSRAQEKIIEGKNAQIDARIAVSYLNVKLRQNCAAGKIRIVPCPVADGNAILIETRGEEDFDRWIFFSGGAIREYLCEAGGAPEPDFCLPIIGAEGFDTEYDPEKNLLTNTVFYTSGGETRRIVSSINLRVD